MAQWLLLIPAELLVMMWLAFIVYISGSLLCRMLFWPVFKLKIY